MLVNMKPLLEDARLKKYAVGSFNVYNYETIKGVIQAIKNQKTPAVIAFGEKYLKNMDVHSVYNLVNILSKNIDVPFALHLDHCKSLENIYRSIRAGFTSVMYDGSALPYEENITNTLKVVEVAHACNVSVEAELGSLASGLNSHEGKLDDEEIYTNPAKAQDFVIRTEIDALAVSIGTVHGMYKGVPNIRIDILKKIKEKVNIPFVLHGGSGTPEEKLRDCIANGICKVNVNTEISMYTVEKIKQALNDGKNYHLSDISLMEINFVEDIVSKYMKIFS
ncbi:class II fructose-bisphosphate aldolase [Clostridium coskatii]|uniref:Fructose-bisphosphate aldolase n=1 Tax=Clostridium coskatii TaxID=1705578 RepID=A0A162LBF3_9CLOT|nr:class II fructose-bisphosphate aldolase [Clostridium coskatii]OAA91356.1 putative fructose-bisphosphate aldolase [Clostridium coskatii]OBR93988.1 putative fructose-bisphosphate aldolase [Clostridium coskatii]